MFSVFFVFVALAVYFFTWERPREEIPGHDKPPEHSPFNNLTQLFDDLAATLRIRAFRLHLGMYLGGYVSQDILNGVFALLHFVRAGWHHGDHLGRDHRHGHHADRVGDRDHLAVREAASRAFLPRLSFSSARAFSACWRCISTASPTSTWFFAVVAIAGLGRGALNYIPWGVYNYMPDVDEIVTGRRREGAFAGVMTFVRKFMQSVGHLRGEPDPRPRGPHSKSRSSA